MKWTFSDRNFLACPLYQWEGAAGKCRWCNKILVGRQRKWCSMRCFDDSSIQHRWTSARKAAKMRDKYRCRMCGDGGKRAMLEVNHIIPILGRHAENGCHHHLSGLMTLCHACHLIETRRQREVGLIPHRESKGQMKLL